MAIDRLQLFLQGTTSIDVLMSDVRESDNPTGIVIQCLEDLNSPEKPGIVPDDRAQRKRNIARLALEALVHDLELTPPAEKKARTVDKVAEPKILQKPPATCVAPRIVQPLRSIGQRLSELLRTHSDPLSEKTIESFRFFLNPKQPLELTLSLATPGLLGSLEKIQKILGPIHGLTFESGKFQDVEILAIIKLCPLLERLSLRNCSSISMTSLEQIAWPAKLVSLDIQGTALDGERLTKIVASLPCLESLNVKGCDELSLPDMVNIDYPASMVDIEYSPLWTIDDLTPEQANVCIQQLLKEHKDNAVALTIIAETLLENFDPSKQAALKLLEQALTLSPAFIRARVTYADLLRVGAKDVTPDGIKALQIVDHHLANLAHPRLLALKARLLIETAGDKVQLLAKANELVKQAYTVVMSDDFVLATYAEILRQQAAATDSPLSPRACFYAARAIAANPHNVYAMTAHTAICMAEDDYARATGLSETAYSINPYDPSILKNLAEIYLSSNKVDVVRKGIKLLEEAIATHPKLSFPHYRLGKFYFVGTEAIPENNVLAKTHLEAACKLSPEDVEILAALGELYRGGGDFERQNAIAILKKAYALDPKNYDVITSLAAILMDEEQDPRQAQILLEQAHAMNPTDVFNKRLLGELLTRNDGVCEYDPDRGIQFLEQCEANFAKLLLAKIYSRGQADVPQDLKKAEQLFQDVFKVDAENVEANLAFARFKMTNHAGKTDFSGAQKCLTTVFKCEPFNSKAHVMQARLWLLQGKEKERAAEFIRNALSQHLLHDTREDLILLLSEYPDLKIDNKQQILSRLQQS